MTAIGLWTVCLTWAHRNTRGQRGQMPGHLPPGLLSRYGGPTGKHLADLLVRYGLWEVDENEGWVIHDFDKYLPASETARVTGDVTDRVTACEVCNADLPAGRRDARFCSSRCRQRAWRRNQVLAGQGGSVESSVMDSVTDSRNSERNALRNENGYPSPPNPNPNPLEEIDPSDLSSSAASSKQQMEIAIEESAGLCHAVLTSGKRMGQQCGAAVRPGWDVCGRHGAAGDGDPRFDAFWSVYPRRVDKGHAQSAWLTAITKAKPETIIEGAKRYRDNPKRPQNPKFVPHPATWLNGQRWTDEDLAAPPPSDYSPWGS